MINNSKKNIALLVPNLCGGGAERVASILSKYFKEHNYNVYVFTKNNKRGDYKFSAKVIELNIQIPSFLLSERLYFLRELLVLAMHSVKVRELKKKYNIHYSISFGEELNMINVLSRYRDKVFLRICTILSVRKNDLKGLYYNRLLLRVLYNQADQIIVMTKYAVMDMFKNYNIKRSKMVIIQNPLMLGDLDNSDCTNENWDYGSCAFITVARLHEVKQIQHIIRAFKEVADRESKAKLLLIGEGKGKYVQYLKKLVDMLGLQDKIYFLGRRQDIRYYLERGRAFVMTSKAEGFPNSMIEALALGIPVISVDCPGAPREILAPSTIGKIITDTVEYAQYGILVPNMDGIKYDAGHALTTAEKLLSSAMIKIAENEDVYSHYKDKAITYCRQFDSEVIGKKWEELLKDTRSKKCN